MSLPCPICAGATSEFACALFRQKYSAALRHCGACGFLFVGQPTWLAEAYSDAIDASDTGYVDRNLGCRDKTRLFIELFLNPEGRFLDYAAGYGMLVRLMRDSGYDFHWYDLYCKNLFSRGFESPMPLSPRFEAVTAFEVFEHLVDPRKELASIAPITSCIIFTTTLLPHALPALDKWPYYGFEHGQHVSFYTTQSLKILARDFGFECVSDGMNLHVFFRSPVAAPDLKKINSRWVKHWIKRARHRVSLTNRDHDYVVRLRQSETRSPIASEVSG
jgi:hypothetical protein